MAGGLLLLLDLHRDTLAILQPFTGFFSIVLAVYLAFYCWNIMIEVNEDEVVFVRSKKPYLRFKFSENSFSFLVETTIFELGKTTSRFLSVFPNGAEHGKNYKLHNFSRKTFEEFEECINSLSFNQSLQQEFLVVENEEDEIGITITKESLLRQSIDELAVTPLEFTVNRQAYIKKKKNNLLAMTIPMAITTTLLAFVMLVTPITAQNQSEMESAMNYYLMLSGVFFILFLAGIFLIIIIIFGFMPYKKARDNTPEKIVLYNECIVFDGRIFNYCDVSQIKMTTPKTMNDRFHRNLTITGNNFSKTYTLGDYTDMIPTRKRKKKNVKIFEDYDILFNILHTIFMLRAEEGKTNVFSAY